MFVSATEGLPDTLLHKKLHEEYMQNLNGTTFAETFIIVTPSFFTIFLSTVLSLVHLESSAETRVVRFYDFVLDFFIVIIPPVLCFTVLSDRVHIVLLLLGTISLSIVVYHISSQQKRHLGDYMRDLLKSPMTASKKPFITNFRAITNVLTVICILAVDFKIFPRRFAKTETFGYALMDTGVGLFCIANSIVSPEVLQHTGNKSKSLLQTFLKSLKSCFPLIVLGAVRFFTTKQADYQMHVTEYGVHWNFFITLAVTRLLSTIIMYVCNIRYSLLLSIVVIVIHELILCFGIQVWVMSDIPRNTFITANREGIVSSLGYVALYLAGVGVGHALKANAMNFEQKLIFDLKLFGIATLLWISVLLSENYFRISRRLANTGYFLWLLTFSTTVLALFLLFELLMHALKILGMYGNRRKKNVVHDQLIYVPIVLEAVSYNGLGFFLLANVLTGLVNMSVQTLMLDSFCSLSIITCYMFVTCTIMFILYCKGIKLKM